MEKLDEIWLSIDNKDAYDSAGKIVFNPDEDAWVFWATGFDYGVTYMHDLKETLATITLEYGEGVYALNLGYGYAAIITGEGQDAGVDTDLDMAGYTVVAI